MDMHDVALLFIRQDEAIESRLSTFDVSELHVFMDTLHSIQGGLAKLKKITQKRLDVFEPPFMPGTTIIKRGTPVFYGSVVYQTDSITPITPITLSTTYEGAVESARRYAEVCNTKLTPYVNEYHVKRAFEVVLIEDDDDWKMLKHLSGGADSDSISSFIESCFEGTVEGWMYKELDSGSEGLVVMTASHLSLTRTTYPTKEEVQ